MATPTQDNTNHNLAQTTPPIYNSAPHAGIHNHKPKILFDLQPNSHPTPKSTLNQTQNYLQSTTQPTAHAGNHNLNHTSHRQPQPQPTPTTKNLWHWT